MDDGNQDDLRRMARLREGDDLALNELMRRWKEPLVTFAFRYTGNVTDAREIAHETFVRVYSARRRYRPKAAFSTWLFAIAANLCRTRARWQSRHPEVLEADCRDGLPEGTDESGAGPPDEADRRALGEDLAQAIRGLPHDFRVAFVLFELQGESCRKIGEVLGCTEKAVERRLARARERLRGVLRAKWREL